MEEVDSLFSVCEKKDLPTWEVTARYLEKYVNSKKYIVIVPEIQVEDFRARTPSKFNIVSEDQYIGGVSTRIKENIQTSGNSYNWYLQQFIKVAALDDAQNNGINLVWDADTVPLKKLTFSNNGLLNFYTGTENHKPYFETSKRLLGYGKIAKFSWIAQCFPCKGYWAKNFISYIESIHSKSWVDCLIDAIDFSVHSSFSEYETFGGFIIKNYPKEIRILKKNWLRHGNGIIGSPKNIRYLRWLLRLKYDYIAFEKWDKKYSWYSNKLKLSKRFS